MQTGIAHLSDESLKNLILSFNQDEQSSEASELIGAYNYDILADSEKAEQYAYVPCHYPDRVKHIIAPHTHDDPQTDSKEAALRSVQMVRIATDFAYLDEKAARQFSFSKFGD